MLSVLVISEKDDFLSKIDPWYRKKCSRCTIRARRTNAHASMEYKGVYYSPDLNGSRTDYWMNLPQLNEVGRCSVSFPGSEFGSD